MANRFQGAPKEKIAAGLIIAAILGGIAIDLGLPGTGVGLLVVSLGGFWAFVAAFIL